MYLRTPKRYRRQRRHLVSGRRLWTVTLLLVLIVAGVLIYQRREELSPQVESLIGNAVQQAQNSVATASAPTPLPTDDPSERIQRANDAWDRGAIEQALAEYSGLVDAAPNNALLFQRIALALIMQGRGAQSVDAAEQAVSANPFDAESWALRALAFDRAGQPTEAISSALQALSIDSNHAPALAYMAEAYLDLDRADLAQETIARALSADPNSHEANYVNALIEWQVNYNLDAAAAGFETASAEAPNLPYIAVDRAWFEWNLGNYDTAESLLSDVLELNPNNLDALYAIAYLYYQAYGDPNQSLDYLQRCTAQDPENIACLAYLGTVQSALGDTSGALETYRRLMRTPTQNPAHFLAAGRAIMNTGDCTAALPLLREGYALENDRSDANAERLALFEEYLSACGAPVAGAVEATAEVTPEAGG